jgi:hypothetical protein
VFSSRQLFRSIFGESVNGRAFVEESCLVLRFSLANDCLVPQSYGVIYDILKESDLWAVYTMLTPRQRLEFAKKYKSLKRASLR